MSSLIIDTSSNQLQLGLSDGTKLISWTTQTHDNQLSKFLLPSIATLLQQEDILLSHLNYIAVGTGPGSFTGIRVGVMVALNLSFSLDIPTIGFNSLLLNDDKEHLLAEIRDKFEKKVYDLEINYCPLTPNSSKIKAPELKS